MEATLLEMKNISKDFFGNTVLEDVNLTLKKGEVLGLVGENGAGKSTLMKILFGMKSIEETGGYGGTIEFDGKPVAFHSSEEALASGIGMVHQEFSLLPEFTATENIVLNRESTRYSVVSELFGSRLNTLDRQSMQKKAIEAINKLAVKLDSEMLVGDMPVGHKQFTEISRELSRDGMKLLILDEPTAVLTEHEALALLSSIKRLAASGISVIFITHRLAEILEVCDQILVMRDGCIVKQLDSGNASVSGIAKAMVGREVDTSSKKAKEVDVETAPVEMEIKNLWVDMAGETVKDVSLQVHKGEILGIGGLAGQGKLGIPNGIMGLYPAGGTVTFRGKEIKLNNPSDCLASGLAFVSEDRAGVGLLLDESLEWNISFSAMQVNNKFLKSYLGGLVKWRDEDAIREVTQRYVDALQIKCTSTRQKARSLSGGNQQKVCLAKALALEPSLLFVSEPTRGIDIGAKSLVLQALRRYNEQQGTTIVMISSELEELRSVCDRIAIITDGKVIGIRPAHCPSEEFGLLMVGHQGEGK
ncbi:MAG: sugar ABC transporter ATP-binding protein [Sphaerochaetaceae bacterium]